MEIINIKSVNTIAKSFQGISKLDKMKLAIKKGFNNPRDLVRISGVPFSTLVKLGNLSKSNQKLQSIKGTGVDNDYLHFFELIGRSLSLGLIKGKVFLNSDDDLVKSLTFNFGVENTLIELSKLDKGINLSTDKLYLNPDIGGYIVQSERLKLIKGIEDFSMNQLDLLYKGVAEFNPEHKILDVIEEEIIKKLNK